MGVGFGPLFLYKIMQSNMLIEFWELFLEMLCECQYLVEGFNFSFVTVYLYTYTLNYLETHASEK